MPEPAPQPPSPRRRRRGAELEAALLEAAWDELIEAGYANLTMEAVAARARTGIAVLYRRWANKDELALAAIEHYRSAHPVELPDTGSLRDDLLAVLTAMSEARPTFFAMAVAVFSGLLASSRMSLAQARERVMGEGPARVGIIFRRAHERGEIDLDALPPALLDLPFDLVRHDMLMELKPLKPARIESIVDELFLPLARLHRPSEAG